MRISDWSSDVCSSDLLDLLEAPLAELDVVEAKAAERFEMNAIEDGLQHAVRAIVGLHRIGEDELTAGLQHPFDFVEYAASTLGRASCRERVWRDGELAVVRV